MGAGAPPSVLTRRAFGDAPFFVFTLSHPHREGSRDSTLVLSVVLRIIVYAPIDVFVVALKALSRDEDLYHTRGFLHTLGLCVRISLLLLEILYIYIVI